jgi:hypothetical protein
LAIAVLDPQNSKWPSGGLFREKTTFVLLWLVYWLIDFQSCHILDYADIGESPELVPDLLRSCLMDPNFPALVEAVESSLKKLMNSDNSS